MIYLHADFTLNPRRPWTALLDVPFAPARARAPMLQTLSPPDGVKGDSQQYMFTVVFSRDGTKLGEAVGASCALDKLTDCTDQMVLDIKSAAKH